MKLRAKPIAVVPDKEGALRALYTPCKHRAHHLQEGQHITTQSQIVTGPSGLGKLERAAHQFHGLVLDAFTAGKNAGSALNSN